jgi:hypothetical protein
LVPPVIFFSDEVGFGSYWCLPGDLKILGMGGFVFTFSWDPDSVPLIGDCSTLVLLFQPGRLISLSLLLSRLSLR